MPDKEKLEPEDARQTERGKGVLFVLGVSLSASIVALVVVWLIFA